MSAELFSIHCILILETLCYQKKSVYVLIFLALYSSTMDLRGSLNFALLL